MYSQYRCHTNTKTHLIRDLSDMLMNELQNGQYNSELLDPLITHITLRLQPWVLTAIVIFGLYFILILAILFLIIRHDIKR